VIERLARALAPEDVQLYYQTAITGRRDLPLTSDPRTGFEMTLLRMVAFRPAGDAAGRRAIEGAAAAKAQGATGARSATPAATAPAAAPGETASAPVPGSETALAQTSPETTLARAPGSETALAQTSPETTLARAPGSWSAIVGSLELGGAARQLASHSALLSRQGAVVRLALDPQHQQLRTPAQEEKLAQALSRHFGEPVRLEFHTSAGGDTPALVAQRASQQELAGARRAFESDPGVQGLRERFGATVLPDTVRPVK